MGKKQYFESFFKAIPMAKKIRYLFLAFVLNLIAFVHEYKKP